MKRFIAILFFIGPNFSIGQSNVSLKDGIYLNSVHCDEMVTNSYALNTIYTRTVHECDTYPEGYGIRTGASTFNVLYTGGYPYVETVDREMFDACTSNNRPKYCRPQFYDSEGKFLLQIGDLWRHGHTYHVLDQNTYTKDHYHQVDRNGKPIISFTLEVSQKSFYRRQQ